MDENTREGMASSKNVHWNTPSEIINPIYREFGSIALDPCSNEGSIVGAKINWNGPTIDKDGLKESWQVGGMTFINPPYAKGKQGIKPWIAKTVAEAKLNYKNRTENEYILLGPARTDTVFFQDLVCPTANKILLWKGRITFLGADAGAFFPSFLAYWGHREDLFVAAYLGKGYFFE